MRHASRLAVAALVALTLAAAAHASDLCPDEQATEQIPPKDPAYCVNLDAAMRHPGAVPLDQYERTLDDFISHYCHRRLADHWAVDKTVRDAGPFVATLADGAWAGNEQGTHMPVLIWYSPEMADWLEKYRTPGLTAANPPPVPDGAIMVKEMYNSIPASACRVPDLLKLKPVKQGAAVMVRDSKAAKDGWFWGWYGWPAKKPAWHVDFPPVASNPLPFMGFGQYCVNCHASARDNLTFASPNNIKGQPGAYLAFLSQDFYQNQSFGIQAPVKGPETAIPSEHLKILALSQMPTYLPWTSLRPSSASYLAALNLHQFQPISKEQADALKMPSQTYDNVWVAGGGPKEAHAFVTSDQCVGCHSAGGTGLQFPMTAPIVINKDSLMYNFSPYGTWRTSPMGLAGRDPIFFAQLDSETRSFHPDLSATVQNTCLGCHGIGGQRQFAIDTAKPGQACPDFLRTMVDAIPDPVNTSESHFGGLSRDGISCVACHHMVLGEADTKRYAKEPQNRCVAERQEFLNPDNIGFARTFTGSFLVGDPDKLYGPFEDPKQTPMNHALGIVPEHSETIKSSEICGACHTVHLPVFLGAKQIPFYSYEQTTYPEWAFSAYRTGDSPNGKLPFGAGALAQSCQGCHMPSADAAKTAFRSKIADIQEHSNFPEAENALPAADIDLQVRTGFAKHQLVGLNVFLIEMARQFYETLGIRTADPMLVAKGVPPLDLTKQTMLDQAANATAAIAIENLSRDADELRASVTVTNKTGHKFPSGVGFRRAFVDFKVFDATDNLIWESGRTNIAGVLVDQNGQPIAGELWWKEDCSALVNGPGVNPHQPHYRTISKQDEVQIFQELVTTPASASAECGRHAKPSGQLTTSFLSICGTLKDNRLLPAGFLPLDQRIQISQALGAGDDMAEDSGAVGTGDDPAYNIGGGDTFAYQIPLTAMSAPPAKVSATLYYQAIPPFFLQDRFCTAKGADADRLRYVTGTLGLDGQAAGWKLNLVSSGSVAVP